MRWLGLVLLLQLAACQDKPDFEERYAEVETKVRSKSTEIEKELGANFNSPDESEAVEQP